MGVRIEEEDVEALKAYDSVSIVYRVDARLDLGSSVAGGVSGFVGREIPRSRRFPTRPVSPPWQKDYDRVAGKPSHLAERWDLSSWGVLAAMDDDERVGGALLAWNTPGVDMLAGRVDLAVLWDLRVHPSHRRRGVGTQLWDAAVSWARSRGCVRLDVETQDINVPACRFYAGRGCVLRSIEPRAYPEAPDEAQLIWSLVLPRTG